MKNSSSSYRKEDLEVESPPPSPKSDPDQSCHRDFSYLDHSDARTPEQQKEDEKRATLALRDSVNPDDDAHDHQTRVSILERQLQDWITKNKEALHAREASLREEAEAEAKKAKRLKHKKGHGDHDSDDEHESHEHHHHHHHHRHSPLDKRMKRLSHALHHLHKQVLDAKVALKSLPYDEHGDRFAVVRDAMAEFVMSNFELEEPKTPEPLTEPKKAAKPKDYGYVENYPAGLYAKKSAMQGGRRSKK